MKRRTTTTAISLILSTAVAGCMVGVDYKKPKTESPKQYGEGHNGPTSQPATQVELTQYWKTFNDPELESLVGRAIENNFDVQTAEANVRAARAQLGAAYAPLFPTVDAQGSYTKSQGSKNSAGSASGSGSGVSAPRISTQRELWDAHFDANWEIDVFGGTRRSVEAASSDLEAQVNARRFVLVTVTAEVARDYITLRGVQRQLDLTFSNLKTQQDSLDLTRSRFKAGLNSDLDVARAQAQVATTAAQIPVLETQIKQTIHQLGILLGQEPMALAEELGKTAPLPPAPSEVPVGLPSELLRRRPDVRQAERQLEASTARIGVAVAELFPKFSLTGSLGQQAGQFRLLPRTDSTYYSFGPTVSWRIFDANQLINEVRVANAQQEASLINYKRTVLQSFSDVEDALVAYAQDQNRTKALADSVSANQRAVDLSNQLYTRGLGDFLNVLDAERQLFAAQTDLAASQTAVDTDLVQLYKALGGGWDEEHEEQFQKHEDPKQKVAME
jgi:NodT family efflux transporter outer membrane factor (OMF) lipoprotein